MSAIEIPNETTNDGASTKVDHCARGDRSDSAARPMMFFTIGYGGRKPADFVALLQSNGVRLVVDVRISPNRANMGSYIKAKSKDKGIEKLLAGGGIGYRSITELGNPFKDDPNWPVAYAKHLAKHGGPWIDELLTITEPFALLCAEKKVEDCHRRHIADALVARGHEVHHIV